MPHHVYSRHLFTTFGKIFSQRNAEQLRVPFCLQGSCLITYCSALFYLHPFTRFPTRQLALSYLVIVCSAEISCEDHLGDLHVFWCSTTLPCRASMRSPCHTAVSTQSGIMYSFQRLSGSMSRSGLFAPDENMKDITQDSSTGCFPSLQRLAIVSRSRATSLSSKERVSQLHDGSETYLRQLITHS